MRRRGGGRQFKSGVKTMRIQLFTAGVVTGLLSFAAAAQQPPTGGPGAAANAEPRTFISAMEIADRIGKADAAAKAGTQYNGGPLLASGPYRGNLEYHASPATSIAVHEADAELFVVVDGSGTMTLGGTLVNPTRNGTNLNSPKVEGAMERKLVKGDMVLVPENTPHAVTQVDGKLVLMSMHLPRSGAAPAMPPAPPAR
jgi:mannose-6-phosphate isomerase-like protein (cupin superfamily)